MTQQVDVTKNYETVMKLVESFSEPRKALVQNMLTESPVGEMYFTAPASSREEYHSCFPGGLVHHSLNVVRNLKKLADVVAPGIYPNEKLVFVGLFHDFGKAGDGVVDYYLPQTSDWHRNRGQLYELNKRCVFMPSAERSLFLLQKFGVTLSSEEYLAIRLNDGMYEESNRKYAMKEPELALLVHMADRLSVEQEKK